MTNHDDPANYEDQARRALGNSTMSLDTYSTTCALLAINGQLSEINSNLTEISDQIIRISGNYEASL